MQSHWVRVAPPAYILQAHEIGYRGSDQGRDGDEDTVEDPDHLAALLSSIPGGSVG